MGKARLPVGTGSGYQAAQRLHDLGYPRVFTRITMLFTVTGRGLSRAAVERAVQLSAEKYCSASIMLAKSVEMAREVEVREAEAC